MTVKNLFVKSMAGFFPEANSPEKLWDNLLQAKVAPPVSLEEYWKLSKSEYGNENNDGQIAIDLGHLASFPFENKNFPRQIGAAIEVGRKLLEKQGNKRTYGLVVATEWTDPSYYEAELGIIPKEDGYSADKQIETIKSELNLSGPALAVDTACASSLYALEIARGMLSTHSLDGVIVIGLNLYLHPFLYRGFTKLGALSKKGALTSFDAEADGIIPGEAACGVLISDESEDALAEINGIGLSSDGNEGSAFSPGFMGQMASYERAYRDSYIKPEDIDYLEAHGTATVLGDTTEINSIDTYFKRKSDKAIYIGSSKSNVGHTLAASGLVSLIKCVNIIQNKVIPPHISINKNPLLLGKGIKVPDEVIKINKEKVSVAISSFGFGGSNAHVILSTPSKQEKKYTKENKSFFIKSIDLKQEAELKQCAPILNSIPMGPKMQERYDNLQRHSLHSASKILSNISPDERATYSCVFLNNLGGSLSLDFERKYRLKTKGPDLSIEGIASTLPSMISGFPTMIFNLKGHHMLLSGMKGSLAETLKLVPYLLEKAEGDILLGIASNKIMMTLLVSHDSTKTLAKVESLSESENTESEYEDLGEATGVDKLYYLLKSPGDHIFSLHGLSFSLNVNEEDVPSDVASTLLAESKENKDIALSYLDLLLSLQSEKKVQSKIGEFLINGEMTKSSAVAQLVVDESHSYFFDHPLDHIPGILTIHACEELLHWYLDEDFLINSTQIRFLKFLEKDAPIMLQLFKKTLNEYEITINQNGHRAGTLLLSIKRGHFSPMAGYSPTNLLEEDRKYTHKHRDENVLISRLVDNKLAYTLPLDSHKGPFFNDLLKIRPSSLYLAEVTRQFVMLQAHLNRKIPLSTKMNLISTEITVDEWPVPPFELHLGSFDLKETEDFLLAQVEVEFRIHGTVVGLGKIKAQVVSAEYYEFQRRE